MRALVVLFTLDRSVSLGITSMVAHAYQACVGYFLMSGQTQYARSIPLYLYQTKFVFSAFDAFKLSCSQIVLSESGVFIP